MYHKVKVKAFRDANYTTTMQDVCDLRVNEISEDGKKILDFFESLKHPDYDIWDNTKWICQAIFEFQDLQFLHIPSQGKFFNIHYLFCEGLSALRESILCGINGQTHASFTVLRAAFEMITTHYWWKEKGIDESDYTLFYKWLRGDERKRVLFRTIVKDTFKQIESPSDFLTEDEFYETYVQLCSYAHKPLKNESLVTIRGSNISEPTIDQCVYWLNLTNKAVRHLLRLMICRDPICLFPVQIYRKFGFNPPAGAFFDEYNFIPLLQALTSSTVSELQVFFDKKDPPKSTLEWFYNWPDLSDKDILETWDNVNRPIQKDGSDFDEKLLIRIGMLKAIGRALLYSFSYGDEGPELSDKSSLFKT